MGICCESELHIIYGVMSIAVTLFVAWVIIESWRDYRK